MDVAAVLVLVGLVGFIGYSLFRRRPPVAESTRSTVEDLRFALNRTVTFQRGSAW